MSDKQDTMPDSGITLEKTRQDQSEAGTVPESRPESAPEPAAETDSPASGEEASGPGVPPEETSGSQLQEAAVGAAAAYVPTRCAKVFNGLAKVGPLVFIAAIALMVWPDFWQPEKALYCPAEASAVSTLLHELGGNSWLTPAAYDGTAWNVPQWPVFYWLAGLLAMIPQVATSGLLLPLLGSITAFLAVFAVWCLAMAAGFGLRAAFASGIITLCAPLFAPLPNFIGPQALSAALLIFSLAFFCRGWRNPAAWVSLPLAFIFAGLAGLSGGWLYLALPLAGSLCFLIWCGKIRRAQFLDAITGFSLLLLLVGAWLALVILYTDKSSYLSGLFAESFHFSWPLEAGWWLAMCLAGLGLLPWLLMIFSVSWVRVIAQSIKTLNASRKENGSALVWICLALGICASVFAPGHQSAAVALVCLAAPLLGKAFMNLSGAGNRFFFLLAAICLLLAGILQLGLGFAQTQQWLLAISPLNPGPDICNLLLSLKSLPVLGGICLVAGLLVIAVFVRKNHQGGGLVFSMLLTIILCQPALLMLVPELGANPQTRLATLADIQKKYAGIPAAVEPAPMPSSEAAPVPVPEPAQPAIPESPELEKAAPAPETPALPPDSEASDTGAPGTVPAPVAVPPAETPAPEGQEPAPEPTAPDANAAPQTESEPAQNGQ